MCKKLGFVIFLQRPQLSLLFIPSLLCVLLFSLSHAQEPSITTDGSLCPSGKPACNEL